MRAGTMLAPRASGMVWTGRVLSGLMVLFFLWDGGMKVAKNSMVVKATVDAGYPASAIVPIGVALVVSTLLYAFPRTAILGAVLLTGYMGGAVATNVHMGQGWTVWFAAAFGVVVWLGIWLREPRLRELLPLRS